MPGQRPQHQISKTPPSDSPWRRASSMASHMAWLAAGIVTADRRVLQRPSSRRTSASHWSTVVPQRTAPILTTRALTVTPACSQKAPADRAAGDPSDRLSRAGPLEHVARLTEAELRYAPQVCVSGPRHHYGPQILKRWLSGRQRPGRHCCRPVAKVGVLDDHTDRRTERQTVPHSSEEAAAIALNGHSSRRGHSRPAAAQGRDRSSKRPRRRPAGIPSTMHVSAGPCDSPEVVMRSVGQRLLLAVTAPRAPSR